MRLFDYFKKPLIAGIAAGILGLILGLVVGWVVWPTEWTSATPQALSAAHQEDYLRMTIDSYQRNQDAELVWIRIQNVGVEKALPILITIADNPGKQDPATAMQVRDRVKALAGNQEQPGTEQPVQGGLNASLSKMILYGVIAVLLLFAIVAAVYFGRKFLAKPQVAPEDYSPARQAQEITKTTEKTDFSKLGLQEPTSRTMTTYVLGDDLYDESFSIDAQSGEFLGEYGVGVSEAIGVGDPKKVTAIEIWLFDKNDIKTATKVLMTPHAYNDPNIRGRLEAKGELVMIEPHGQVLLETQTLQMLATVVDLEYGHSNLPEKSYFDRITLELAVWPK